MFALRSKRMLTLGLATALLGAACSVDPGSDGTCAKCDDIDHGESFLDHRIECGVLGDESYLAPASIRLVHHFYNSSSESGNCDGNESFAFRLESLSLGQVPAGVVARVPGIFDESIREPLRADCEGADCSTEARDFYGVLVNEPRGYPLVEVRRQSLSLSVPLPERPDLADGAARSQAVTFAVVPGDQAPFSVSISPGGGNLEVLVSSEQLEELGDSQEPLRFGDFGFVQRLEDWRFMPVYRLVAMHGLGGNHDGELHVTVNQPGDDASDAEHPTQRVLVMGVADIASRTRLNAIDVASPISCADDACSNLDDKGKQIVELRRPDFEPGE